MKQKPIATVRIKDCNKMTKAGRKMIAQWIRKCARDFERDGWNYSTAFTANYFVAIPRKKEVGK